MFKLKIVNLNTSGFQISVDSYMRTTHGNYIRITNISSDNKIEYLWLSGETDVISKSKAILDSFRSSWKHGYLEFVSKEEVPLKLRTWAYLI